MVLRLREFDSGEGNTLGYNNQFTLTFNNMTDRYELLHNAGGGVAGSFDANEKDKAISFIDPTYNPTVYNNYGFYNAPEMEQLGGMLPEGTDSSLYKMSSPENVTPTTYETPETIRSYEWTLPTGNTISTNGTNLDEALAEAQKEFTRIKNNFGGFEGISLEDAFSSEPKVNLAGVETYINDNKTIPVGTPMGGQNVRRNTATLERAGYTIENGVVTGVPYTIEEDTSADTLGSEPREKFDYSDLNRSMTFDEFMRSDKPMATTQEKRDPVDYTSPYGTGGETIRVDPAMVSQYENYVRGYYSPYQHSSGEDTFALVEGEIEDINQYKALGYNDEDIKKLLSDKYDYRATPVVEEVDQGSMMDNMVGADDDLETTEPIDDTFEPVSKPEIVTQPDPIITSTPTYSVPSTPSFTTQPMSSGTYQSPTVTQPQFTGPVDPNTGTFQLQQGMGFAPSNVQFNVPEISTGVLGQGQSMGYNPTLQLVAPQPYVQSGYMPTFRYNEGGMVPNTMQQQQQPASAMPMTQSTFGGFKPEAMQRIAGSLGYQGDIAGFDEYLNANPDKKQKMDMYNQKAMQMAKGGVIHANEGTYVPSDPRPLGQQYIPEQEFYPSTVEVPIYDDAGNQTGTRTETRGYSLQDAMATQALFPGLPTGATVVPVGVSQEAGQFIDPRSGQVYGSSALPTALATTTQAGMPQATPTTLMTAATGAEAVDEAVSGMQPAQGEITDQALVTGQEGVSSLNIDAAQGTATMMTNPVTREIQSGELISGAADAQKAAKFTEQIQAATAEPSQKATVQGQLEGLMQQFEGGDTPAWAAGAMRNAMGAMAARGLGASSLAGQAAVQAAMESALPIAQADAQTQAKFESQNLSNRQQRAMLAAQQRAQFIGQEFDQAFQSRVMNASKISDVANMNFTAEQQVALENSRAANSMNLANLSNRQASVMAEAAAIANMDMANLNNRQQAAVMNAQSFLQMDMANLSNKQQTELFQAQQRVQSLFNDQAAINAAAQFNASSQNQTDQFFANLANQTSQFNASQANAQSQFNAGQTNVIERFNTEINNQREQFNASNRLVIDQANATWRREIATMDTAAVNRANETNAEALLGVSRDAYNNLWQYYSDNMEWAWTSAENEKTRYVNMALAELNANAEMDIAEFKADYQSSIGFGNMIGKILTTDLTGSLGGTILGDVFDFLGG